MQVIRFNWSIKQTSRDIEDLKNNINKSKVLHTQNTGLYILNTHGTLRKVEYSYSDKGNHNGHARIKS